MMHHSPAILLSGLIALTTLCSSVVVVAGRGVLDPPLVTPELMYNWTSIDWDFSDSGMAKNQWVSTGRWEAQNCIVTGVKIYKDITYVSVPRWRPGVPATLNTVVANTNPSVTQSSQAYVLKAWPDWPSNDIWNADNTYSNLWYIQSMEIDPQGRMWALDVGRLNIFAASGVVNGPPKLVVYDLTVTPTPPATAPPILREFVFPNDVAPYTSSFLNDLVIDTTAMMVYISDTGVGSDGKQGGIVVYDYNRNMARRYHGPSTMSEAPAAPVIIDNYFFTVVNGATDGIALSTDRQTLYYSSIRGVHLYALPTTGALMDFSLTNDQLTQKVVSLGVKLSQSDGMAVDSNGILWYGLLSTSGLAKWDTANYPNPLTAATQTVVYTSYDTFDWIDTFAFDHHQSLVLTTNRLSYYFNQTMDWSGKSGPNMRVWRVPINADSYMTNQPPPPTPPAPTCDDDRSKSSMAVPWVVGVMIGFVVGGFVMYCTLRANRAANQNLQFSNRQQTGTDYSPMS